MLVVIYVISVAAAVLSAVFEHQEKIKQRLLCIVIAIISAIAFCVPVVKEITINSVLNFKSIFAALSLIAWQYAFLRNDIENIINYQIAVFLLTLVLNSICYAFFFSFADHVVSCTTEHVTTQIVPIVTTIDGTASGKSIYGDGFVICSINEPFSDEHTYQYYYRTEDGSIIPQGIYYRNAEIVYVDSSVSPYVEVTNILKCFGYTRLSGKHKIIGSSQTYILYIPEGSIKQVAKTDTN